MSLIESGLIAVHAAETLQCVPHRNGISYIPKDNNNQLLGQFYFDSEADCLLAIESAASGLICLPGPNVGNAIPYSLNKKKILGSYYFNQLDQCVQSVKSARDDLICVQSQKSPVGIYDLRKDRFAERYYRNTLGSCVKALGSPEVAKSRDASFPPGQVSDCRDVRLDAPGGSMEHVAVRDQGQQPICFAHVAAQMADAWRFTHGDRNYSFQTSGLMTGLRTYSAQGDWELNSGGFIASAVEAIRTHGSCDSSSTIEALGSGEADMIIDVLKSVRKSRQSGAGGQQSDFDRLRRFFDAPFCIAEKGALASFDSVVATLQEADPKRLILRQLEYPCKANQLKFNLPKVSFKSVYNKSPEETANLFSATLTAPQRQPVAISICSQVLDQRKDYRAVFPRLSSGQPEVTFCDGQSHAMLLIGKRKNPKNGRCEFLIRNTWGTQCASARKLWECEKGSLWMDAEAVARNVSDIHELPTGGTQ